MTATTPTTAEKMAPAEAGEGPPPPWLARPLVGKPSEPTEKTASPATPLGRKSSL